MKRSFKLYFERNDPIDCRTMSFYEGPILIEEEYSGIDIELHGFLELKNNNCSYKVLYVRYDPIEDIKTYIVLFNNGKEYAYNLLYETNNIEDAINYVYSLL